MGRYNRQQEGDNGLWAGIVILCVGLYYLLRKMGLALPSWVLSWEMLLILIGFLVGIKRRFQGAAWFILILIGGFFMLDDVFPYDWDIHRFLWPAMLCVLGIYLIGRSTSRKRQYDELVAEATGAQTEDFLQATSIFGSNNKAILSKNFRGGSVTNIFGGSELNFMQADIQGEVIVDVTLMFGSLELIIPSNWDLKMDVTTIFGGIEDKRPVAMNNNSGKVLVLKGTCTFGGIDIKSY